MLFLHVGGPILLGVAAGHAPALLAAALYLPLARLIWRRFGPLDPRRAACSVLIGLSAAIHLGLVPGHLRLAPFEAFLFLADAALLAALAASVRRAWFRPAACLLLAGNVVAYGVFVASGRESVDDAGILTKLVELLAFGLAVLPARTTLPRLSGATASILLLTLTGGVLAWGGILRDHGGAYLQPLSGAPSAGQRAAAAAFAAETWNGIARYQDPQVALADGYRASTPVSQPSAHWSNPRYQKGPILDPSRPQALVYANTVKGPILLGAMFVEPDPGRRGPDYGGAVVGWHEHPNICVSPLTLSLAGITTPFGNCPPLTFNIGSTEMLHVWRPEVPSGPYGDLDDRWLKQVDARGELTP